MLRIWVMQNQKNHSINSRSEANEVPLTETTSGFHYARLILLTQFKDTLKP